MNDIFDTPKTADEDDGIVFVDLDFDILSILQYSSAVHLTKREFLDILRFVEDQGWINTGIMPHYNYIKVKGKNEL